MENQNEPVAQWAIVEIFGHKTLAGCVTKDTSLFPMLRIDVPATSVYPAFTVEHGPAAIFSIVYVSEQVARLTAESIKVNPIAVYNPELVTREKFEILQDKYHEALTKLRGLPSGDDRSDDDDDRDDDDDTVDIPF